MSRSTPSVTIAIPALNEEQHIERVLDSFSRSVYPNIVEILVADGGSVDATRELVSKASNEDPRIRLINNPGRIQSAALNEMIAVAKGEVFLRADAHCDYIGDYVSASIKALIESGAQNAGGAQRFVARTPLQAFISIAVRSTFGSGGARYRDSTYNGYSDTVFIGCYYTATLRQLGGFRTDHLTNEDYELNIRLKQIKPQAIYISSDIQVHYYPRPTLSGLIRQYFIYGRGRCITTFRHPDKIHGRGLLPFLTILSVILTAMGLLSAGFAGVLAAGVGIAASILIVDITRTVVVHHRAFREWIWKGSSSQQPGALLLIPGALAVVLLINVTHFAGFGTQLIRMLTGRGTSVNTTGNTPALKPSNLPIEEALATRSSEGLDE